MVENAARFRKCLTINWHDRSLAPEQLWKTCYSELLQELKDHGAWFATASQTVEWFRKRRAATSEIDSSAQAGMGVRISEEDKSSAGLQLRNAMDSARRFSIQPGRISHHA
jgi:hypothetical protein